MPKLRAHTIRPLAFVGQSGDRLVADWLVTDADSPTPRRPELSELQRRSKIARKAIRNGEVDPYVALAAVLSRPSKES